MRTPLQTRSESSADRMLAATLALLDEGGPGAVTVAAVARAAGASNGSLYHRFGDRHGLLLAAQARALGTIEAETATAFAEADTEPDDEQAVALLATAAVDLFVRHGGSLRAFLVDVADSEEVRAVPGVLDVVPVAEADGTTLLRASWDGNSQSEASQDLLRDLREVQPASGEVLVGGLTAETVDLVASVSSHLPLMGLIVVGVMLVLLFLAFGSVVLPVKAVVMNLFSITASFGVVTWIFSDGNLADTLGFAPQGFLDATNPILMLAILFGLSMDYEVFLLSRVREEWDRSHDNDRAVAAGVQKTGRIITSAALLLGVVIGAFGTSGIVFMKMLGVGMLVALLIDATVVRALLVPATMKLLGRWNWYAPGPMARWWERHGFREEGAPEPAPTRRAEEPAPV